MVAGHAVGIAAVAVCVLYGHQRDVPVHSMLQLCAKVFCRSCMRACVCVCVCVCVICTIYEVDPYAAMRWQVYSAQSAVASLRM